MFFSIHIFGLFGVHKQVEWAHFERVWSNNGPSQDRKIIESGQIWDHKWLKNGSKQWFSNNDPSPVVVPEWMNAGDFEPLLGRSHPVSNAYLICR